MLDDFEAALRYLETMEMRYREKMRAGAIVQKAQQDGIPFNIARQLASELAQLSKRGSPATEYARLSECMYLKFYLN